MALLDHDLEPRDDPRFPQSQPGLYTLFEVRQPLVEPVALVQLMEVHRNPRG